MLSPSTWKHRLSVRLHRELPDALDRVIFSLFVANITLSALKLAMVVPLYWGNTALSAVVVFAFLVCILFCYLLFAKPRYLRILTKIGLLWMAMYIVLVILTSPDRMNLVSIQHMFIVIMLAFYGVNRVWGMVYAVIFSAGVLWYLVLVEMGYHSMSIFPESLPFPVAFIVVLVNFMLIAFIHFLYNKTLEETDKESRELNEQLKRLVEAKSEFLSTMSHELRTPLNSLVGTAYLLADNDDDDNAEHLANLRFSAENLLTMINNILDYSKMDSKRTHLERIPFHIGKTFEQVTSVLKKQAADKSLDFTLNISEAVKEKEVVGDPTRLIQIIFNVLGNAIKFTPKGYVAVQVEAASMGAQYMELHVQVSDSGIGIDPDKIDAVFHPFQQASGEISREYGGTGLGLAIVKHLVELHGGVLRVESAPKKGSVFHINLPYKLADFVPQCEQCVEEKVELITKRNHQYLRLLVAEDNQMSVVFMKKLLSKWQITPTIATDGEQVVSRFKEEGPFDVVLMDIHMPKISGREATAMIREWEEEQGRPAAYIIALTASVSSCIADQLSDLGFDDYLSKPFRPDDLLHKIEAVIRHRVEVGD